MKSIKKTIGAVEHPYWFHEITEDEESFEQYYLWQNIELVFERKYEPLIKQLLNNRIQEIPIEYLILAPSYIKNSRWRYTKETFINNHPNFIYPL